MRNFWKASALAAVVLLAACGGDDDDANSAEQQELIDAMVAEGATVAQANCFIDELGFDDAERFYGADDNDLSEDELSRTAAAFETCAGEEDSNEDDSPTEEDSSGDSSDDDSSDDSSDDGSSGDDSSDDESASGDLSAMKDCAESAGLTVADSTAPDGLDESLGIVDSFTVVSSQGGAGMVTLYADGDLATEAREFQSDTEGGIDGVTIGQVDELVYSYSGDNEGLASLEGCL